jgi:Protein of unknown function (DUF2934)
MARVLPYLSISMNGRHSTGGRRMKRSTSDGYSAEIEELAYRFWEERGCPFGSPEEDWLKAERESGRGLIGPPERLPFSSLSMGHVTS